MSILTPSSAAAPQNCHLAASWLSELEKIVEDLRPEKVDEDFRLWLTSLPTPKFPVSILQNGVKMTNEPPKGLKLNLFRSFKQFDESYFTATKRPREFKKLLYSLAFFHAVVLDRRKFGPLGWNIRYRFTELDLDVTLQQLIKFIDLYADDGTGSQAAKEAEKAAALAATPMHAGGGGSGPALTPSAAAAPTSVLDMKSARRGSTTAPPIAVAPGAGIPFKIIHFLTYDINYGGRVTDDIDRRTIKTILDDFMCPEVLSDEYQFTASDKYKSIAVGNREHYLKSIMAMESVPTPDVFGMHDNADITSAEADTAKMFTTILNLMPRRSAGGDLSRDKAIADITSAMLARVPVEWELEAVSKQFPTMHSESMNTVIVQETIRYNHLLQTMRRSLEDLLRALAGDVVMTEALEAMSDSLFTNQIPKNWAAEAYPSLKSLADWFNDLLVCGPFPSSLFPLPLPLPLLLLCFALFSD
jgi:dynein heavy chain